MQFAIIILSIIAISISVITLINILKLSQKLHWLNPFRDEYNEAKKIKMQKYSENSVREESGGIVFIGDSITEMYDTDNFYTDYKVINRGIGGDTTRQLLRRLYDNALIMKPKLINLLVGINDLGQRFDNSYIVNNIEKIIVNIKEQCPDTKIILQSIYPIKGGGKGRNRRKAHNEDVRIINIEFLRLSTKYNLTYVDMFSLLIDDKGNLIKEYSSDGLHPNNICYNIITAKLKEVISKL